MNMKKSLITAAVASVCAAPMAAQAQPTVFGEFIAGFQQQNADARTSNPDDDGEFTIALDSANLGAEGSHELDNGMMVEYGTELAVVDDGENVTTDNTFAALTGDFGSAMLGWGVDSAFYYHVLEATDVGEVLGSYIAFARLGRSDVASDALQYANDVGVASFTADVQAEPETAAAVEDVNRLGLGASFDAGPVTIGIAHESDSVATPVGAPEPSLTGVSVSGGVGNFGLGLSYAMLDTDTSGSGAEPTSLDAVATTDFGGGLSGALGVGMFDADTDDDQGNATGFHVQLAQSMSDQTMIFAQLQSESVDGGNAGADLDPQTIFAGISHAF